MSCQSAAPLGRSLFLLENLYTGIMDSVQDCLYDLQDLNAYLDTEPSVRTMDKQILLTMLSSSAHSNTLQAQLTANMDVIKGRNATATPCHVG